MFFLTLSLSLLLFCHSLDHLSAVEMPNLKDRLTRLKAAGCRLGHRPRDSLLSSHFFTHVSLYTPPAMHKFFAVGAP
jgi:hypothetical protein